MVKICALVVTYNRSELLCRCITHLLSQDYPLDILIYDNHSTDKTLEALKEKNLFRDNVQYFYADSNTGGSGGFHNGMKMLIDKGYDALWLMDDDGYPIKNNTLSIIIDKWQEIGCPDGLFNSLVVCDEEKLSLTFSLDREYDGKLMTKRAKNGLLENLVSPFNGTVVTAGVINKIGYPIKDFFVYGDETEYTLRIRKAGFKLYTVVDSLYFHPLRVIKTKRFLWFKIACNSEPLWKEYCSARNTMYYYKIYFGFLQRMKKIIRIYIGCLMAEDRKIKRIKIAKQGIRDGLKGDLSKKPDFSLK